MVHTNKKARSANTAPSAKASLTLKAPRVTGRWAVRLTWRSNSRSATSLKQQPAERIKIVPSTKTPSKCQPGQPPLANHKAESDGHKRRSQPAGRFQRMRSK